jgi:hypothetical protein
MSLSPTINLSSFIMQDQVPHPYTRMAKIIVLSVLIFHFTWMEDKKDSGFCDVLLNGLVQHY